MKLLTKKILLKFLVLFIPGVTLLLSFQNCAPVQFESISDVNSLSDNKEICSLGESKKCQVENGTGIKECKSDSSGFEDCRVVSCDVGFRPVDGKCVPSECSNGAINAPVCNNCGPVAVMIADKCIAKQCEANEVEENCLNVENGKSSRVCNDQGTGFGVCEIICDEGYQLEDNKCIAKPCTNGALTAPDCKDCNADRYYDASKNICVAQVCIPGSEKECDIAGGIGTQICNEQGAEYGSCILVECDSNHTRSGDICIQKPLESCTFNGKTIASGQSSTAYQNSSVPYGSSCVSESRLCTNGVLSGTYAHASCSVGAAASCTFNGKTIASGQSSTAYQNSSVPYGSSCVSESRLCTNGVLSGTYAHATCQVDAAPAYSYYWQSLSWGSCSANPYWSDWGSCSASCGGGVQYRSCLNTSGTQTRSVVCKRNDGVTVADSNCSGSKPSTSQSCSGSCTGSSSQSCSTQACPTPTPAPPPPPPPSASCGGQTVDWGSGCSQQVWGDTPHGQSVYVDSAPPTQGSAQFRCDNGNFIYISGSCTQPPPQNIGCAAASFDGRGMSSCDLPSAGHGQYVNPGCSGSGSFGDCSATCSNGSWINVTNTCDYD